MGFSPGFSRPALKRMINVELFPATLKRCFPLLKQRAPTKLREEICGFSSNFVTAVSHGVVEGGSVVIDHAMKGNQKYAQRR